jgi:glycosyltransferase involved in cell wall biosynthesis
VSARRLLILGTRGIPAAHGGFETFAEQLALYLVQRGWKVTVYCQENGNGPEFETDWQGVRRVHIPVAFKGAAATVIFDWHATVHASRLGEPCLTLGYNTAVFCSLLRWSRVPNIINMDGIEWRRAKWGVFARCWLWLNERAGARLGNHLVADHPEIARRLARLVSSEKITTIPYGADRLSAMPIEPVLKLGLEPGRYLTLVARPEPENTVLEVVQGFSCRRRGVRLVVLGNYVRGIAYHDAVRAAASDEVVFLGAVYDRELVQALRFHCAAYVHGHQVGGTNPSLVEALGAGNAIVAHDNPFNRWVAGNAACYFTDKGSAAEAFDRLLEDPGQTGLMRTAALLRHEESFTWPAILAAYEAVLSQRVC